MKCGEKYRLFSLKRNLFINKVYYTGDFISFVISRCMVDDMVTALRQTTPLHSAQSRFKNNSLYIGIQLHNNTEIDKFT